MNHDTRKIFREVYLPLKSAVLNGEQPCEEKLNTLTSVLSDLCDGDSLTRQILHDHPHLDCHIKKFLNKRKLLLRHLKFIIKKKDRLNAWFYHADELTRSEATLLQKAYSQDIGGEG